MHLTPSSEQTAILASRAKTLMVEARAGTGKTTTLSMLAGQEPGVTLGLCFSEGARVRFYEKLRDESPSRKVQVLTVEVLARSQLTRIAEQGRWLELPKRWSSLEQVRPFVVEAANAVWRRYQDRFTEFDFEFEHRTQRVEMMLGLLATLKGSLASLRFDDEEFDDYDIDALAEQFQQDREAIEICREFERRRQPQAGHFLWQTSADYAVDLVSILRRHPEAVKDMPRADLILVDEWHDVNAAEFELLNHFRRQARLVVVGDRHQVINAERGADLRFSSSAFEETYAGAERLPLSKSRRCGVSVKKVLDGVLPRSGFESHPDTYTEVRTNTYDPTKQDACAIAVADRAQELIRQSGVDASDIAIVVREADQTVEIENQLLDRGVPYSCDGADSYLLRPEVMLLRALLHMASGDFSTLEGDRETCERLVDSLLVYLSVSTDPNDYATDDFYGDADPVKQQKEHVVKDPSTLMFLFDGVLCREQDYDSSNTRRWKQRFKQVVELLKTKAAASTAADLVELASQTLDLPAATRSAFVSRSRANSAVQTVKAFTAFARRHSGLSSSEFLQELRRRQDATAGAGVGNSSKVLLTLTTVQAAKGREWPVVLLPYLEKGQFPRTVVTPEEKAEESRYLYVAVSRVVSQLHLFEPDDEHASLRSFPGR